MFLSKWLNSVSKHVSVQGVISCESPTRLNGKNVLHITEDEFCVDPVIRALTISMSSVAGVVVVVLSVACSGWLLVRHLRVKLYTRWRFHPFDRDECLGEDMDYDVYFCCSSQDDEPEGRRIVETMEANGYRVCYHYRDFMPGLIVDSIGSAVTRSKRTVCLLTVNFIRRFAISQGLLLIKQEYRNWPACSSNLVLSTQGTMTVNNRFRRSPSADNNLSLTTRI